jgi:hypothetical protein
VRIRFLSLDCSKLGERRIKKAIPGYYLSTVKGGSSSGILGDICAYTYDIYLVGHKALPDAAVQCSPAIWVNIDKLPQFHQASRSGPRREPWMPSHHALSSGCSALLQGQRRVAGKEDEAQKKLLALNP